MADLIPLASLATDLAEPPRRAPVGRGRVALVALGCPKNLVDAEQMLGVLAADGYQPVLEPANAEVVIVHTCSFLEAAREEAIREIRAAGRRKRQGSCETLLVTGCLAQKDPERIHERCPEVDAIVGVSEFPRVAALLRELTEARTRHSEPTRPVAVSLPDLPYQEYLPRRLATPPWTAYLKIAEGCDCACSFCTIPSIRGSFRSRPIEAIVAEAARLAADGVKELVLIAEDLTHYGRDWSGRRELARLLHELAAVDGVAWLRLLYCYPTKVDERLIEAMAELPQVLPYVDMPLQHAHDELLRAMSRGGRRDGYLRLIARLREAMPEVCLRSTFIVGFPGERQEHFAALSTFLDEAQLDRVGFFPYSREPGTPAADLPGQVPHGVARARVARLADQQAAISAARNAAWIGRELTVLVERRQAGGGVGRSFRDAPEIDGVVHIDGLTDSAGQPGEFVTVRVTSADVHDLHGRWAAGS